MAWLFPGMLAATMAAAVPLLIHLLMRPRPRRQVFPALRLLREAHRDGARARRVQHWLVLAARMAAIVLLALALARPVLRAAVLPFAPRGAVNAVFCLDDSASMGFVQQGRSDLQRAVEWAAALIGDEGRFGGGSRIGVVRASEPLERVFTPNRDAAIRRLQAATPGAHDRGLREMLDSAARMLAGASPRAAGQAARSASGASDAATELYVLTDLTRHGCRPPPGVIDWPAGTRMFLLDVSRTNRANASLQFMTPDAIGSSVAPSAPEYAGSSGGGAARSIVLASDRPARLAAVVRAVGERFVGRVEAWLDGQFSARSEPLGVVSGAAARVELVLPALSAGLHAVELRLEPRDALGDDDVARLAIEARPRPRVAIALEGAAAGAAAGSTAGPTDAALVEARRMAALLSPAALPEDQRPFDVRTIEIAALNAPAAREFDWIILLEPRGVAASLSGALADWVRGGGLLLLLPGPAAADESADWSGASALGAEPLGVVEADRGAFIAADDPAAARGDSAAAGDRADAASLAGRRVQRYARLRPADDRAVRLRFDNGDPAIVDQSLGDGRAVWWAFSLRGDWSDMGARAAPILLRLHALGQAARGARPRVAQVLCGQTATVFLRDAPPPAGAARRGVQVLRGAAGDGGVAWSGAAGADGRLSVETAFVGFLRALPAGPGADPAAAATGHAAAGSAGPPALGESPAAASGDARGALIAVNLPPEETDAARLTDEEALALFPRGAAEIHRDGATLGGASSAAAADRPLDPYLLLLAVALLFAESALSRRAYRRAAASAEYAAHSPDDASAPL